jgi:hypothetical protein
LDDELSQYSSRPVIPKGATKAQLRKLTGADPDAPRVALPLGKTDYYRSPEMMVAVRKLHCGNCGRMHEGNCGAHPNWSWASKGKSIKAHDLPATLCPHCHVPILDQGKDLSREERERMWLLAFYRTMLEGFQRGIFTINGG